MSAAETIDATVVIIGSGVAGALAACRLSEKGVSDIVLVEAGPRIDRADIVRNFMNSPHDDFSSGYPNPAHAPRPDWTAREKSFIEMAGPAPAHSEYLRVVGGTTWHWAGSTPRLHPADFALRTHYGIGQDWPFGYTTLAPYYNEAEAELGVAGDNAVDDGSPRDKDFPMPPIPLSFCDREIAKALSGINFFSRPVARASRPYQGRGVCDGFGSCMPICPSGAQYTAAIHVEQAEKRGVRLLANTRADRIVADAGRITHIEAKRADNTPVILRAKIFVLAANGMETPRLLLMGADESNPAGIANSSGQVGRNYIDHPGIAARLLMPKPVWQGRGPVTIMASHDFRNGGFRKKRPGWILSTNNRSHVGGIAARLLAQGVKPPALDSQLRDRAAREVVFEAAVEQLPDAQNGITLDWSRRDSAGQPVIRHYYSIGDYEEEGFAHIRDAFTVYARQLGAEVMAISSPFTAHHMMGMTRMGQDAKTSVADGFGRCHDHKNLFIAGASLFPAGGCVNPTLTIAALSLRSADEIARQLKT